jgi:hypothetical protein
MAKVYDGPMGMKLLLSAFPTAMHNGPLRRNVYGAYFSGAAVKSYDALTVEAIYQISRSFD